MPWNYYKRRRRLQLVSGNSLIWGKYIIDGNIVPIILLDTSKRKVKEFDSLPETLQRENRICGRKNKARRWWWRRRLFSVVVWDIQLEDLKEITPDINIRRPGRCTCEEVNNHNMKEYNFTANRKYTLFDFVRFGFLFQPVYAFLLVLLQIIQAVLPSLPVLSNYSSFQIFRREDNGFGLKNGK